MKMKYFLIAACFFLLNQNVLFAQITLLGDNAPYGNIYDGNFKQVKANWRQKKQSPCWKTYEPNHAGEDLYNGGEYGLGIHQGTLYCVANVGVAESLVLNTSPQYTQPKKGDVLAWSFGADLEYISDGTLSLSLVFGEKERMLASKVKLIGSDKTVEHFKGHYVLTEEDAKAGHPFVRVRFYTQDGIKVFLHYVNVSVVDSFQAKPKLMGEPVGKGIQLTWDNKCVSENVSSVVYRSLKDKEHYLKLGETFSSSFLDSTQMCGRSYTYVVVRTQDTVSAVSNKITLCKLDTEKPLPPSHLKVEVYDAEIKLSWQKSKSRDVKCYSVFRSDEDGHLQEIAHNITRHHYLDFTPTKEMNNRYVVVAYDYSGNVSEQSKPMWAKVKMVKGASFSDLILPMPIHKALSSETWGAKGVKPRDVDNGIEHNDWSYWGGRPVLDNDGLYHLLVTRWPANDTKGHWEWPRSTVAHAVSEKPTGPYRVKEPRAYEFADGFGHNPDVILLNDGTYLLYSLINWEATLFSSASMNGLWKRLGVMKVDENTDLEKPKLFYRFYRNLSGVQMHDGRFLFVTKGGAMMRSKGTDPLGPYTVLTSPLQGNPIIPEKYRKSNMEDPVLWKDKVQYHMIINAFWDYRAIYLRSPDGIHWTFNAGTAYTPNNTRYEDGTQTHWYKLERPHVLTDQYGRATHLSLAVIDVPKADDLARDNHNSKNIVMPLIVHKRLEMLNEKKVTTETSVIRIKIKSEDGFDAQKEIDIESLRLGATEVVDFGRGCKVLKTKKDGKDLIVEFDGKGNGLIDQNFVCKLLGKTKGGEMIIGYCRLKR